MRAFTKPLVEGRLVIAPETPRDRTDRPEMIHLLATRDRADGFVTFHRSMPRAGAGMWLPNETPA